MQPPARGRPDGNRSEGTVDDDDPVVARIEAWVAHPTVEDTLTLCEELRRTPSLRFAHVDAVARTIHQRHANEPRVLAALGRLQLTVGKLTDAQLTLVEAGRLDPDARDPYRYLGELLLRRGEATRAEPMLAKAVELESQGRRRDDSGDDSSAEWLARARRLQLVQQSSGEAAVAAEIAALTGTGDAAAVERRATPGLELNDSGGALVTTNDLLTAEQPAFPSSPDAESVPVLRAAPPSDQSPDPVPPAAITGRLRALQAQAVTLGAPAAPATAAAPATPATAAAPVTPRRLRWWYAVVAIVVAAILGYLRR